jgi:hypothetical protein
MEVIKRFLRLALASPNDCWPFSILFIDGREYEKQTIHELLFALRENL